MLYLLDANVLIRADEEYYGFDLVPQFWDWLFSQCQAGHVKMPLEIWQEVCGSRTQLGQWINDKDVKARTNETPLLIRTNGQSTNSCGFEVRGGCDAQWPRSDGGFRHLAGRGPDVVAGEVDMLPAQR